MLMLLLLLLLIFLFAFGFGFCFTPPLHLGGVKSARADRLGLIWWGAVAFRF